jgi:electron transport complex protein RnfB
MAPADRVTRIDALLPQTQCTKCGFEGCRPYAEAIDRGEADIDRCPPGGQQGVAALAALLQRPEPPLDRSRGATRPWHAAHIDPALCIGCTLCISACPVDAIIGAPRRMHTVIAPLCSGCDLCLPACPVDCITMHPQSRDWQADDAVQARERHQARAERRERHAHEDRVRLLGKAGAKLEALAAEPADAGTERKRALIEAAIQRARKRLAQPTAR